MKRVLCLLLAATLPFAGVLADAPKSKNAKVTLVYQYELHRVCQARYSRERGRARHHEDANDPGRDRCT